MPDGARPAPWRAADTERGLLDFVTVTWLLEGFTHPERVDLPTRHHLRPIREADVDIDYPAIMGSRERLWTKYGEAGWPPVTMSYEADKEDLARHEAEIAAHETFNYAIVDERETELFGCVYIDAASTQSPRGSDAVVSWWVCRQGGWHRLGADARRLHTPLAG
jgi:hypothetical protein